MWHARLLVPEMLNGERYTPYQQIGGALGVWFMLLYMENLLSEQVEQKGLKQDKNEAIDYATLNMEVEYADDHFTDESSDLISKLLIGIQRPGSANKVP